MEVTVVISARTAFTLYPGKAVCDICGMIILEHVFHRKVKSESVDETYVATPDDEIRKDEEWLDGEYIIPGDHT